MPLFCEQVVEAAGNVLTACASALSLEAMLPAMGKALTSMKAVRPRLGILQFFVSQASRCHQPAESSTLPMRYANTAFHKYESIGLLQCGHQKSMISFKNVAFLSAWLLLAVSLPCAYAHSSHDITQLMSVWPTRTMRGAQAPA